jgi:hypothetical protein
MICPNGTTAATDECPTGEDAGYVWRRATARFGSPASFSPIFSCPLVLPPPPETMASATPPTPRVPVMGRGFLPRSGQRSCQVSFPLDHFAAARPNGKELKIIRTRL